MVHDLSQLALKGKIDAIDLNVLQEGMAVDVEVPAFPGFGFDGTIRSIGLIGSPSGSSTSFPIEVEMKSEDDRLRLGIACNVEATRSFRNVLTVPMEAVQRDGDRTYVLVQRGENTIEQDVVLGLDNGTDVVVLSGLKTGDVVELTGGGRVAPCVADHPDRNHPDRRPRRQGPRRTAVEAQDAAVAWMIEHQNPDGSWGTIDASRPYQIYLDTQSSHQAFGGATSALGVMSLVEPSRTDPAAEASLQRGVEHLVTMPEVGKASGNTFYDIWTHTYMISALCRVVADPRFAESRERIVAVIEREIDILRDRQGLDGGWGYYDFDYILENPSGDQSTSFNTAAVLLALEEARARGFEVDPRMVEDGIKAVERMRLPNGAYAYGTYAQYRPQAPFNMIKGSLGRSQPCNLSLHELERNITLEQMQAGVERCVATTASRSAGVGRSRTSLLLVEGYYYFFGHYAGMVIEELEEPSRGDWPSGCRT